MPQIKALLEDKERFPNARIHAKNQEEAVACGAAVYAKMLEEDENAELSVVKAYLSNKLVQISTHSYGARSHDCKKDCGMVFNLIFKGNKLPVTAGRSFYTRYENQEKVTFPIYENNIREEKLEPSEAKMIGACTLEIPEGLKLPKDSEIKVTFHLTESGILSVEGLEPVSGKTVNASWEVKI